MIQKRNATLLQRFPKAYFAVDVDRSIRLHVTSSNTLFWRQAMMVTWFITNFHTVTFPIGSMGKTLASCLNNTSALAVTCWVIIHCLEVSCKGDQITSLQLTDKQWSVTQQFYAQELIYFDSNTQEKMNVSFGFFQLSAIALKKSLLSFDCNTSIYMYFLCF